MVPAQKYCVDAFLGVKNRIQLFVEAHVSVEFKPMAVTWVIKSPSRCRMMLDFKQVQVG